MSNTTCRWPLFAILISCGFTPGCAMMQAQLSEDAVEASKDQFEEVDAAIDAPALDVPSFLVEIRPEGNDPQRYRLPLTDEATFVEDIVKKSGVVKRFGRVQIQIWRPLPGKGYHKISVKFNRKARAIAPGYNYAIHAQDLLVLTEDTTTFFDDMLEDVTGPLDQFAR